MKSEKYRVKKTKRIRMFNTLYTYKLLLLLAVTGMLCGCNDDDFGFLKDNPSEKTINIAGIATDELIVSSVSTRAIAKPAETEDWLVQPLKNGLDITYGLCDATPNHEDVAILKLSDTDGEGGEPYDTDGGIAVYTFKYRENRKEQVGDGNDAIWYNNGQHYFQGVHVPDRIRYTENISEVETPAKAPGITVDQHDDKADGEDADLGNYTLLSHYLGMPANYRLTATVERIKLPFRHRLARVVAFVLIDPDMNTTLKGYKKDAQGNTVDKEDPNTTSIRFCNVKVLQAVKDSLEGKEHPTPNDNGHHILIPQWTEARKVIPHFDGECGSYNYKTTEQLDDDFKYYYKETGGKLDEKFPTTANWQTVHDVSGHQGYTEINYGKVPVYDIIVRPTYTSADSVMYDEDFKKYTKSAIANQTNKIDFEIELENGLRYEKRFTFDLNANYQTVVYLRISREHVDYNDAGSDMWIEEKCYDGWYGMDNENGNTLSYAGSSWQRAYTYLTDKDLFNELSKTQEGVTDGHFYNASSSELERESAQYFKSNYKDIWVKKFLEAYKGGKHHGDYFVLRNDIDIDARLIPKDFIFTGHLDGQDHTITLTNTDELVYKQAENITPTLYTKSGGSYTEWAIPALHVKLVTPIYYREDELETVNGVSYLKSTLLWKDMQYIYYTQAEADEENQKPEHHPLTTDANEKNPEDDGYIETRDMEHYVDGYTPWTTSTVKSTIPAHYETKEGSVAATTSDVKEYQTTYPVATASTSPAYPTTLEQLKTNEYYDHSGTLFLCPQLYQFSHISPAYLFSGLDGEYTTNQESAANPYASGVIWEANVHKETNKKEVWVPTSGYRAEVMHVKIAGDKKLFKDDAVITGNVQNCWNGASAITNHTPAIPQYK